MDMADQREIPGEVLDLRKPNLPVPKGRLCSWCGKRGVSSPNGLVGSTSWSYCSERCYEQFRRAVFKKRSACLWCSNAGSGGRLSALVNFQSSLDETKFCSECCLTQFKLKLFCEETTSHLNQIQEQEVGDTGGFGNDLITPALWLANDTASILKGTTPPSGPTESDGGPKQQATSLSQRPPCNFNGSTETKIFNASATPPVSLNRMRFSGKMAEESPIRVKSEVMPRPGLSSKRLRRGASPQPMKNLHAPFRTKALLSRSPTSNIGLTSSTFSSPPTGNQRHQYSKDPYFLLPFTEKPIRPSQSERISFVPVPFPFLFPVIVPPTNSSLSLDPIEELE